MRPLTTRLELGALIGMLLTTSFFSATLVNGPAASAQIFSRNRPLTLNLINADRSIPALGPYMVGLRQHIESHWIPRPLSPPMRCKLTFEVVGNGSLQNLQIVKSSGNDFFDQRAVRAIRDSGFFHPTNLPVLFVEATFDSRNLDISQLQARAQYLLQRQQQQQQLQHGRIQKFAPPSNQAPDQEVWADPPQTSHGAGSPEVGPQVDSQPAQQSQSTDWTEPLAALAFNGLSEEEKQSYKEWLKRWFEQPFEDRFAFLSGVIPDSPAQPKRSAGAKQAKGKRK